MRQYLTVHEDLLFIEQTHATRVQYYIWINADNDTWFEVVSELWEDWSNPPEDAETKCLRVTFRLDEALNETISFHSTAKGLIDPDAKPLFDAMKKDYAELIEKIDSLKYNSE